MEVYSYATYTHTHPFEDEPEQGIGLHLSIFFIDVCARERHYASYNGFFFFFKLDRCTTGPSDK